MAAKWVKFPHADKAYAYDSASLKKHWDRLHAGDREPFPKDADAQTAWRNFHAGEFQQAVAIGTKAGGAAVNAAVKAQTIYAIYLEKSESRRHKRNDLEDLTEGAISELASGTA